MAERDYSFEALAEETNTDWAEGRGQLNAALASIRRQSEIDDDYLLSCEIHDRAKMYRALFTDAAMTPTSLAKHWLRVKEETSRKRGGVNLHADPPSSLPPMHERNLGEARRLMETLWPPSSERDIR